MDKQDKDPQGTRMKTFEKVFTNVRLDPEKVAYARLDGRSFSKFTKGMERPFDSRMSMTMIDTAKFLVEEMKADIGYTQSDEISLGWMVKDTMVKDTEAGQRTTIAFDHKIQKLTSVLAGMCSAKFYERYTHHFERHPSRIPHFDCRLLNLDSEDDLHEMLAWRQKDATRNAVSMAAQSVFSHRELQGVGTQQLVDMLWYDKGIVFGVYPAYFKNGTFITRRLVVRDLTPEELERIPADRRPTGPVTRTETVTSSDLSAKALKGYTNDRS